MAGVPSLIAVRGPAIPSCVPGCILYITWHLQMIEGWFGRQTHTNIFGGQKHKLWPSDGGIFGNPLVS